MIFNFLSNCSFYLIKINEASDKNTLGFLLSNIKLDTFFYLL